MRAVGLSAVQLAGLGLVLVGLADLFGPAVAMVVGGVGLTVAAWQADR